MVKGTPFIKTLPKWLSQGVFPVLAMLFLVAQFIGTAHTAAYGSSKHSHDGQPCIIASTCKQLEQVDTTPAVIPLIAPAVLTLQVISELRNQAVLAPISVAAIRAPPAL